MIYEDLKKQFQQLTEEEQNAFLIYKSKLGLAMNALHSNPKLVEEIYEEYNELLKNPKNLFMKISVFHSISFASLDEFRKSLERILSIMKEASKKIILKENITVYRAISIPKGEDFKELSKEDFISTSLDFNECGKFFALNSNEDYVHYLYQMNIESGGLVGICPYTILKEKDNCLKITQRVDQKEIILDRENFVFEEQMRTDIPLEDKTIHMLIVDVKVKEEERKR